MERLQKILARSGAAPSRRAAEELIRAGKVTVNGEVAELGRSADPATDAIKLDGRRVHLPLAYRYFLLYKPAGYLTTSSDPEGRPTVFDLLPPPEHRGLVAVGRLDFDSEGLILLTDDGDFAQRVAHPRYGCRKTYEAKVKGEPNEAALARLRRGMVIDGRKTGATEVSRARVRGKRKASVNTWWTVVIGEGRTRQVREMFFRVGHPVQRLRRVKIGSLSDPDIPTGAYRTLSPTEVRKLAPPERGPGKPGAKRKAKARRG